MNFLPSDPNDAANEPKDTQKTFGDVVRDMARDAKARKNKIVQHGQQKLTAREARDAADAIAAAANATDHNQTSETDELVERRQQSGEFRDRRRRPQASGDMRERDDVQRDGHTSGDASADHRVPSLPVISPRALAFTSWRAGRTLHKQFSALRISKRGLPPQTIDLPDKPVLVYCNQPTVWTSTLGLFLANKIWPAWRHYAPAEPDHISRFTLTDKIGLFPAPTGKRGRTAFLRTASNILCCPGHMLWLPSTPAPADPRLRPMPLQNTIAHLARRFDDIIILPLAIEHPFRTASMPEALIRFGEPLSTLDAGRRSLQGWHTLLQRRLQIVMDRLAEESADPHANEFEILW